MIHDHEPRVEATTALPPEEAAAARPAPAARDRLALRVLQAGALVSVLAVTSWKVFELDRFFVPKELALHATACAAALLSVHTFRRRPLQPVDLLLLGFLVLSVVSAVFATNPWAAARAVAIGASGIAVFWAARTVGGTGLGPSLVGALALAVVAGAATSLMQTYGVRTELFSENRAPGGVLGNRNFIAHMAAFGLPVVLLAALQARRAAAYVAGSIGVMLVVASLILTRSRAGWLAFGAVIVLWSVAMLLSPPLRRHGRTWLRLAGIAVLAGAAVAAAVGLPNTLRWRSDSPYLESMRSVANYQEGSGRGRLIQYQRSLRMVADRPLLGAGPGNWGVVYPDYAVRNDPSLDRTEAGMTSNPWPSSDWIAFVSERGPAAALLLAGALAWLALGALRRLRRAASAEDALRATSLLATLAATLVAGAFDAVLLLASPTLLVMATLGVLSAPDPVEHGVGPWSGRLDSPHARRLRGAALVVLAVLAGLGALRSAGQLAAMGIYAGDGSRGLRAAALLDPGNYRVHMRLARTGSRDQRCRHAEAAHALYPNAAAARSLARRCD